MVNPPGPLGRNRAACTSLGTAHLNRPSRVAMPVSTSKSKSSLRASDAPTEIGDATTLIECWLAAQDGIEVRGHLTIAIWVPLFNALMPENP